MGRELRRVPANWVHPTDTNGHEIPLYGSSYSKRVAEWDEGNAKWAQGFKADWKGGWKPLDGDEKSETYEEWDGKRPVREDYMPDWPDAERTHYQMYENVTEGTPISPVMESPESLAQWLADNNANAGAFSTANYEQWLATIQAGSAPSMVFSPATGLISGVEAMTKLKRGN